MPLFEKTKALLNKASSASNSHSQQFTASSPPSQPLSQAAVPRYRKQHGVNLGSWFMLEAWIASSPFKDAAAPKQSDLDVAKGKNAKRNLEEHWDSWIKEDDWKWIVENGFDSVRLPVSLQNTEALDTFQICTD
jgi:glucan 1,3-beta-glucosidase